MAAPDAVGERLRRRVEPTMIPYGTDAPVYHWPFATLGLIVANVAASFAAWALLDSDRVEPLLLTYGDGLHPVQWITSNFLHAGPMHLIGNMVYLWGFGLIVEGKVGWFRFLLIYFGIGAIECAIEQGVMLGAEGGASMGASAIVYGLVAIGMVWAPRNDISILLIYGFGFMIRTALFDIPIVAFAAVYFAWELLTTLISGMAWGSPVLHLIGAAVGFVVGTVMVKAGWVDCEGWDLYSPSRGLTDSQRQARKPRKKRKRPALDADEEGVSRAEQRSARALAQLRGALEADAPYEALSAYHNMAKQPEGWRPLEKDILSLIALLQREKLLAESVPVMEDYVARFPEGSPRVRLKLAQVLLRDQNRPSKALRLLAGLAEQDLPPDLRPVRRQMEARARAMTQSEDGIYELDEG